MKVERVSLRGRELALHPAADMAFAYWSAMPSMVDLTRLPPAILCSMLERHCLVALDSKGSRLPISVIAGFQAFRLLTVLELRGASPSHILISWVSGERGCIAKAVQSELCEMLIHYPSEQTARLVAQMTRALSPEMAVAIFGRAKVDRRTLARMTGIHPKHLVTPRSMIWEGDSDILSAVLDGAE